MFNQVKMSLRLSGDTLDDDIRFNIKAALLDMGRVGINTKEYTNIEIEEDPLITACVILYCKWIYNYLGKGEDWLIAYEKLRDSLSLCGDYN